MRSKPHRVTRAIFEELLRGCKDRGLPAVIEMYEHVITGSFNERDWFALLEKFWMDCDNVGEFSQELDRMLPARTIPEMMNEGERAAHAALPDRIAIYRGADRGVNVRGWSWSLDQSIASRFPFLNRSYANPVLVTTTVARDRVIAVKLGREEQEIIVNPRGLRLSITPLKRHGSPSI